MQSTGGGEIRPLFVFRNPGPREGRPMRTIDESSSFRLAWDILILVLKGVTL
jgi:hypothetical protein